MWRFEDFFVFEYPRLVGALRLVTGDADRATDAVDEACARDLLGGFRAGAPAELFAHVWSLVCSVLTKGAAAALATRLGI